MQAPILLFFCRTHNEELIGCPSFVNAGASAWEINMESMACGISENESCKEHWDYTDLSVDVEEEFK